jgi:hypothetical protein
MLDLGNAYYIIRRNAITATIYLLGKKMLLCQYFNIYSTCPTIYPFS